MGAYKNYKEIDRDLKILKLQTQIDKEKINLSINNAKQEFSPVNIATNIALSIAKRAVILKSVNKILGVKKKR